MQTTTVLSSGGAAIPMQNVVIVPSNEANRPTSTVVTNYAKKTSRVLGVLHIIIGLLCIVFNVIRIAEQSPGEMIGHGIWCGLFFILTGAYGLIAGFYKTKGTIIIFMVLSIVAASAFALCLLVIAIVCFNIRDWQVKEEWVITLGLLMIVLALMEAILGAWSAALGCSSLCCGRRSQYGIVMQQVPVMMDAGGTQVMYTAGPPATYLQTGNMRQQQGFATTITTSATPPPPAVCSQYGAASVPPPYLVTAPSGAEAGAESYATTPLVDERKVAL